MEDDDDYYDDEERQADEDWHRERMNNMMEGARQRKLRVTLCEARAFREHLRLNAILLDWDPLQLRCMEQWDEYIIYVARIQAQLHHPATLAEYLLQLFPDLHYAPDPLGQCREVAQRMMKASGRLKK